MSRLLAAVAFLLLSAGSAWAQMLPGNAAPPTHPGTKLNFPATAGGAQLERSYTQPVGRDVHYVYMYLLDKVQITFFVFDNGRRVPSGSDNPTVISQFAAEIEATEKVAKTDGYTNFEKPSVPSICTYGSVPFRCVIYSALERNIRLVSKLMMTGFRDHFLKVRADWSQATGQTAADAERALKSVVPAIVR